MIFLEFSILLPQDEHYVLLSNHIYYYSDIILCLCKIDEICDDIVCMVVRLKPVDNDDNKDFTTFGRAEIY